MKLLATVAALTLLVGAALAQPAQAPADPAMLQRVIAALQIQRNQALDEVAGTRAQLSSLSEMLNQATAKVKELETKAAEHGK